MDYIVGYEPQNAELKCGFDAIYQPLVPSNENAFNPCFISWLFTYLALLSSVGCGFSLYKTYYSKRYGNILPKSTGLNHYIRVNSVILHGILFMVLTSFTNIHERYADPKIIAFSLTCLNLFCIVLPLHFIETSRRAIPHGSLLIFWTAITILEILLFYQDTFTNWRVLKSVSNSNTIFSVEVFLIMNSIVIFMMEYSSIWNPTSELVLYYKKNNMLLDLNKPNLIERMTFSWMNELIVNSYKNQTITEFDLPNSPTQLSTENSTNKLSKHLRLSQKDSSLFIPLMKSFGLTWLVAFAYELADTLLNFVQPQLLKLLIQFFNEDDAPILKGLLISFSMFSVTIIQTSLYNQYILKILEVMLGCRSSITSLVYQKSLRLSSESKLDKSSGDIINLISVDVNRVQDVLQNLSTLIIAPTELVLCIISLWSLVGKSTISGLITMILLIPLNTIIVRYSKKLNKTQMKLKDTRSRIINEILSTIKSIKLYTWEKPMLAKLLDSRNNKELKNLKKIRIVSQFGNFIWTSISFLVSFATFATFALTEKVPLTSEIVFPALSLLNLLSNPLVALPAVINSIIEASVAISRIKEFLLCSEINEALVNHSPKRDNLGDITIKVRDSSFLWSIPKYTDDESSEYINAQYALRDINFTAKKGELSCIIGRVGSGKSAFLSAILGQLDAINSKRFSELPIMKINGSVAYCSQMPWIMNASIKENITFGHKFDPEFYQKTIDACQLLPDLAILPDGDDTQVGEKGISLSGGQKARLALARAVYSRADIYLLDDILSAVDSHVGKKIIENVLSKQGLLASKTIVLSTNSIPVLNYSDQIYLVETGGIVEQSNFYEIDKNNHPKLFGLISEFGKNDSSVTPSVKEFPSEDEANEEVVDKLTGCNGESCSNDTNGFLTEEITRITSHQTLRRASIESFKWNPLKKLLPNLRSGQLTETKEMGKVKWDVYYKYAKACSILGVIISLLLLILTSTASVAGNYWLKHWTEKNSESGSNEDVWKFITVYAIFGLTSSLLSLLRAAIIWTWLAIRASTVIHDRMSKRIISSPMVFFERTPIGRIMNRFTNDINKIDDRLPRVFNGFFTSTIKTIFTLGVVGYAMPYFSVVVLFLSLVYGYYQKFYVSISRELKRLVSVSRSPIYAHLQESLNGVDTIRAYKQIPRFNFINNANVDFNLKSLYMQQSINRWLAARLQFIGSIVILSASSLSIYSLTTSRPLSSGMAGFVMSYALQVTSSLNWVVRMSAEVESNIVSVERCLEYCDLPVEEEIEDVDKFVKPPINWPNKGAIKFTNYSTRYRDNLDLILKNLNFEIQPSEKIGVVGRTGAGKSSLALAIFRIIEAVDGNIGIDGLNSSELLLYDLRHNLSIIPQDSQLFEGTIRQNLDPFDYYSDEELWKALELAHLKDHVSQLQGDDDNKLNCKVAEGGANFSSGQRQLMSLARVLLKLNSSKILILDEATAAVDVKTDKIIQETIRSEFKHKTIITIAHRLETVMDSDRILSLDRGEVKEFDTPHNLLQDESGIFYSLCKQGGYI